MRASAVSAATLVVMMNCPERKCILVTNGIRLSFPVETTRLIRSVHRNRIETANLRFICFIFFRWPPLAIRVAPRGWPVGVDIRKSGYGVRGILGDVAGC
jgi:hypothetical protein